MSIDNETKLSSLSRNVPRSMFVPQIVHFGPRQRSRCRCQFPWQLRCCIPCCSELGTCLRRTSTCLPCSHTRTAHRARSARLRRRRTGRLLHALYKRSILVLVSRCNVIYFLNNLSHRTRRAYRRRYIRLRRRQIHTRLPLLHHRHIIRGFIR